MPVTVHPSSRIPEEAKLHAYPRITSPEQLLSSITTHEHGPSSLSSRSRPSGQAQKNLIQSSFSSLSRGSNTYAAKNGLVYTIIEAYNNHHNLILRPDDVWLAILSQLSVYINGNADALRHLFVADKGRKELFIEVDLSSPTLDHGAVATRMAGLLAENLLIKDLDRDFILPDFTTTTDTERATAAVMFMGTMQKYFVYSWGTRCGLPAVTLLGEVDDWTKIHDRVAMFLGGGLFGPMAAQWLSSLGPVLKRFIETFKTPRSEQVKRFWGTIVKENKPNGSGGITYSGWMVGAFCWFDERGRVLGGHKGREIRRSEVPMGFVKVPVTLLHWGQKIEAEMVAGLVGMEAEASNSEVLKKLFNLPLQRMGGQTKVDTLMPVSGWFMYRVRGG